MKEPPIAPPTFAIPRPSEQWMNIITLAQTRPFLIIDSHKVSSNESAPQNLSTSE